MPRVTINGRTVDARTGQTVLEAARDAGGSVRGAGDHEPVVRAKRRVQYVVAMA